MTPSADERERERERAIVKASEAARERGEDRALVAGLWVEVPTCRSAKRPIERAERPRSVSPP